jgi:hypothetical protein
MDILRVDEQGKLDALVRNDVATRTSASGQSHALM